MKTPLKIAVCEDFGEDAAQLVSLIENNGCPARTVHFESGGEFLKTFQKGRYDLVFLDIYMSGMTGVDVAEAIRETDGRVVIIFTTTSEDFTREGYRLNAYKYLLKPVTASDVADALELAQLKRDKALGDTCTVVAGSGAVEIPLYELYYAEVFNYRCLLHTKGGRIETNTSIDNLEKLLPRPRFLRCHRSYIVNLDHVKEVNAQGDFVMASGDLALVRVRDRKRMKAAYEDYLFAEARREY